MSKSGAGCFVYGWSHMFCIDVTLYGYPTAPSRAAMVIVAVTSKRAHVWRHHLMNSSYDTTPDPSLSRSLMIS